MVKLPGKTSDSAILSARSGVGVSIDNWFFGTAQRCEDRPALSVDGKQYTYKDLSNAAQCVAEELSTQLSESDHMVALFGQRSAASYAGVLGILASGCGYVPLNHKFPLVRTLQMLDSSGARLIVVDVDFMGLISPVLEEIPNSLTILCLMFDQASKVARVPNQHQLIKVNCMSPVVKKLKRSISTNKHAYLVYTSGSTGVPKGVACTHDNVNAYVQRMLSRYEFRKEDRFSQCFDLTFDLSVHEMLVCWGAGACLYCVPERAIMSPVKFIREKSLTVWFSVPSTIAICQKLKMLKPNIMNSLRISIFCGEALPANSAAAWARAAPNSSVDNLYGPTEATVLFTGYTFLVETPVSAYERGILPIGQPYPGLSCVVLDENREAVANGEVGELWLGGDQLAPGYWNDPKRTQKNFLIISIPGYPNVDCWYRTGDRARYSTEHGYIWLGRTDSQIKLHGHRVELGEIEHFLRIAAKTDLCVALDWPRTESGASGIVAFISGDSLPVESVIRACRETMPSYMVPRAIHCIEEFPLNSNGKIDRGQLRTSLDHAHLKAV